jgi:hypothetical protein
MAEEFGKFFDQIDKAEETSREETDKEKFERYEEQQNRVNQIRGFISKSDANGKKLTEAEIKEQKNILTQLVSEGLKDGILCEPGMKYPLEIDPESLTNPKRLEEYLLFIVGNGPAKNWDELQKINPKEEEFGGPHSKAGWRKDTHLMLDNSGTISLMMNGRFLIPEGTNDAKHWGRPKGEYRNMRQTIGAAHFDYSNAPDWLKKMFDDHWESWKQAAIGYYEAKENSKDKVGGFFE